MYIFLLYLITYWNRGLAQQLLDIRLAGANSSYSGRVEILSDNGEWGTICDDYWGFLDALVVCRQLGFGPALAAHPEATFGAGNGPIYLDGVECIGNEESLFDCDSQRVGDHDCGHHEDAGVECVNLDRTIRLVGGHNSSEGRVEIFVNGQWGTVCDNGWDLDDATVVCRQLGFNSVVRVYKRAFFGRGTGPVWMTNTQCTGNEADILACNHDQQSSCSHRRDASVACTGRVTIDGIRLADGATILEGRVEVMIDGQWGTICDDNWSIEDGHVVCRELGFLAAIEITQRAASFGEGQGEIWLNNVMCTGSEASLAGCMSDATGSSNCRHYEDAGVRCLTEATYSDIRLTGGMTSWEGRVEILLNGQWGTICDDLWDINAANVVCRELGYPAAESDSNSATFGEGSGPIWLDDVRCNGNELSLRSCSHNSIVITNCGQGADCCAHHEDVGVKCEAKTTYSDIRLTGGMTSSEGRVEILFGGQWGTICDHSWDINAANVVCRELGYPAAESNSMPTTFGRGSGPIWLDDVRCNGNELSLASCSHNDIGITDCGHHEDVGVHCQEEGPLFIEDIRLVGGSSALEGRVEIFVQGEWGTICDDDWDINDARVVCRELGFGSAVDAITDANFGEGSGPIWLDDVQCAGNETALSNCTLDEFGLHNCEHHEDAGVICLPESLFIEKVRLAGGSSSIEGRVEIFVQGQWGTICGDKWDIEDAQVVCKQLGFESAVDAPTKAFFGRGIGPIWLDDVECEGDEITISNCKSEEHVTHNCFHEDDASVVCLAEITSDKIVLTGGTKQGEGILEVSINGKWEALCDDEKWGVANSYVVCRQLGFDSAVTPQEGSVSVFKSARTWVHYFQCSGDEKELDDCSIGKYMSNYTCEAQLVAVTCLSHEKGTVNNDGPQAAMLLDNWIYIGGIMLLITIFVVILIIGFAVCRSSRRRRAHPSGQTDFAFQFSTQLRPLPIAPLSEEEEYVRMHRQDSCNATTVEKPGASCGGPAQLSKNNTYTPAFEQTKHYDTPISEEVDTTYATNIFDSDVLGNPSDDYQPIGGKLS